MTAINANETINTLNPATLQEIINMSVTTALKQVNSITPHSCRHYFASLLLTMGIPVNECMRLTGHDNYKTFMKYAYVEQTTKESLHIFVNTITDKSPIVV